MAPKTVSIRIYSMRDYLALRQEEREWAVPKAPAVYCWNLDFASLVSFAQDPDQLVSRLELLLACQQRTFSGQAGPYYRVSVANRPLEFSKAKVEAIRELAKDPDTLSFILECADVVQQPLYIGKTTNLNRRLKTHTKQGSPFRGYLAEAGIDITDCCLAYFELPNAFGDTITDDELTDAEWEAAQRTGAFVTLLEALLTKTSKPLLARRQE